MENVKTDQFPGGICNFGWIFIHFRQFQIRPPSLLDW